MASDPKTTVVARYLFPAQAQLARVALEAEGLPCFLANVNQGALTGSALVPIELHVLEEDLEAAKEVLAQQEIDKAEDPGEGDPGPSAP